MTCKETENYETGRNSKGKENGRTQICTHLMSKHND